MAKRQQRDTWERDLRELQRNTVFPDTVRNEIASYDYLVSARRLTPAQRIGSLIIGPVFLLLGMFMCIASIFGPRIFGELLGSRLLGLPFIPLLLIISVAGIGIAVLSFRMIARGVRG